LTVKALLRHGAKPNLPVGWGPAADPAHAMAPAERLLLALLLPLPEGLPESLPEGLPGDASDPNEVALGCLEALAAAGARLPAAAANGPFHRWSDRLRGPATSAARLADAHGAWQADNPSARRGTVLAHKAG
jgi:hypothetical protein